MKDILLLILIGIAAAFYGIHSGRAKADRFRAFPETLKRMRVWDWVISIIIVAGIFMAASTLSKNEEVAQKNSLREQFRLSADVNLVDFRQGESGSKKPAFSATVHFTPQQWKDYINDINDPTVWQPRPLRRTASIPIPFKEDDIDFRGDIIDGDYAANARVWYELPEPLEFKTGLSTLREYPRLYHYWWDEGEARPKAGRIMCYIFHRDRTEHDVDTPQRNYLNYKVSACADLTKRDDVNAYVLGILDFDKKTLRMVIE